MAAYEGVGVPGPARRGPGAGGGGGVAAARGGGARGRAAGARAAREGASRACGIAEGGRAGRKFCGFRRVARKVISIVVARDTTSLGLDLSPTKRPGRR
jgi:hypothetical protein